MIVLANGAFKSGSTWLKSIAEEMMEFGEVPFDLRGPKKTNSVATKKLPYINSSCNADDGWISKTHFYNQVNIDHVLSSGDIKVLYISRGLQDVIVSHYYHFNNKIFFKIPFKLYFWSVGLFKAYEVTLYNTAWDFDHACVFHTTFESLKNNTNIEINRLAHFLEQELSSDQVEKIVERTSLKSLQIKNNESSKEVNARFFRKGVIGEGERYLDCRMKIKLRKIEAGDCPKVIRWFYDCILKLRRDE